VQEVKVEMIFPAHLSAAVLSALKAAHPYEEVAYSIHSLDNSWQDVGSGYIGTLEKPLSPEEFLDFVKKRLGLKALKHTALATGPISKVAVCGGAGSFLIKEAKQQADAYITSDIKYHEFFDAENQCLLIDVGHYESEVMIIDAIHDYLSKKISTFAVLLKSETNTNPVFFS
jgi:putative NIF3 family GTP cyclohydrolase 1 type 2